MPWAQRWPSLRMVLMMRWMTMMLMIWMMVPYLEECHAASLPSSDQAADSPPSGSGQVAASTADPELEGTPGSPSGSSGEISTPVEESESARTDPREEDANSLPTTEIFSGDVLAQEGLTGEQESETVTPSKREEPTGYLVTESSVDDASSEKENVSKSQPASSTVSQGRTTSKPTTLPQSTPRGISDDAKKNELEVSEGYSRTPDSGRNSDDDSTEDNTPKKNETTTERSQRTTPPESENQTPSSSVGAESQASLKENQTFRTVQPGTTPQSPTPSAEESVTSLNTLGPDSSNEASNASSVEPNETLVTLQNESSNITNTYTFSKPPSEDFTTVEDIFTKEMESSKTAKTGPGFKVTSDQLFVSGSRKPTRRQTRSTNGLTLQHTTADVSSTVPSNVVESTSVEMSSTVWSSGSSSGMTSEELTTVTMPTTSVTTEIPETSTSAWLGMKCSSDESCAEIGIGTMCLQDFCVCQSGYHRDVLKNACIREPYSLTAKEQGNTCVSITWQGGSDVYNVTVTSSVSGDETRSERMTNTWGEFCPFSPGSNVTVSVKLISGGIPATTWVVLKPSPAKNVEISFVNETCVTATWQGGAGYTQLYNLTMPVLINSSVATVSDTASDTQWTRCNLEPGSKFYLQVRAFSHGKNSENSAFLTNSDSTVPSQPIAGWAERSKADPRKCVILQWVPGPGWWDYFNIPGYVRETKNPNTTVCGLQPGSHYLFNISAYSDPRSSEPLVVEACTDPKRVQMIRVEQIDATWATLSWESPSKGGADRYIIRGNYSDEPVVTDRTSATVVGLSSGTTYNISVEAEFCNQTSKPRFFTFMTKFSALTSVNVSATGTILEVFWESDQKKGVPVELIVKYKERTVFEEIVYTSPRRVQTNRSGVCFNVSLRVVNSSQVQTLVHATEPAAPEEVRNLQARRLTNERRSISVTWSPPAVPNGIVAFYNVSVRGLRGFQETSRLRECQQDCTLDCHAPARMLSDAYLPSADKATNYSVVIDKLSEYENYIVTVTAFTSAGEGLSSSVRVEGQLLDSVSHLKVEEHNSTCLSLTWTSPANADADAAQDIHYLLEYQEDVAEVRKRFEKNVTNTHCLLCGLQYWTEYRVNITAVNVEGPGRTDTRVSRTAEHVPGVVSNVAVSPETSILKPRQLEVTWSAPAHPHGIIRSYFVTVRDRNTTEVIERQYTPQSRQKRAVDGWTFKETFGLIGDHHYHVQVFGATGAGNGSSEHREVTMPAGVLPPSGDTVHFNPDTIEVTSLLVDIPASLLCNFTYGAPVHAGYIVYRTEHAPSGIRDGMSPGSRPVVSTPWSPSHTPFYVQMDVRAQCEGVAAHGKHLSVRVGTKDCGKKKKEKEKGGGGSGAQRSSSLHLNATPIGTCGGPLEPNSRYRLLVVFCTSAACRYTQPAPAFTTRPQPEDPSSDTAGLAAGLTVVFLLLLLGGPAAFYWVYRKKQARSGPVILPQPTQETECREIICRSRPVALDGFVDHVQLLHRDSNLGFSDEYKTIKDNSPYYSVRAAELPPCKPKNRYMNILPWDQSRVKLIPTDDEEGSDYINANYLPGENHQREFIAAQGPLPGTVDDFWRMVWENRVCVMVMLTQCVEKGKTKCERYWPDEGVQTIYGDLVVQVRSQSVLPDYIIRVIDIKLGNQSRMIKHFHFMRWPDHGCPERTSMLLNFVSSVRAHMPHSGAGPTLVHCSAGVGRTGTFIALDRLLLQIRQKTQVDIFNLVFEMREHRMQMVQTENQYVYIHDCLADALTKDKESDDDQSDSEEEHIYGNC